jgi:hypothetical protein
VGLDSGKIAAFQFYGGLQLKPLQLQAKCPWLIAEPGEDMSAPYQVDSSQWNLLAQLRHPADGNQTVLIFRRR